MGGGVGRGTGWRLSVSTLHYVIGRAYLTVGIICKYWVKVCMSSPLVLARPTCAEIYK